MFIKTVSCELWLLTEHSLLISALDLHKVVDKELHQKSVELEGQEAEETAEEVKIGTT